MQSMATQRRSARAPCEANRPCPARLQRTGLRHACQKTVTASSRHQACRRAAVWAPRVGAAVPRAAAGQAAAAEPEQKTDSPLQSFLRWLLANGVEGVGAADSSIALYEGEGGERGVVAVQPIAAGQVVMRIPLRLAITDAVDEEEQPGGEQAPGDAAAAAGDDPSFSLLSAAASSEAELPWSVRLAGRLLCMLAQGADQPSALLQCQAEKEEEGDGEWAGGVAELPVSALQAGSGSPWQPYLRVLPASVPAPLTTFSWEDVQAVEYPPMRKALDHTTWLAADAAAQRPGGRQFSKEHWEWALSVVHSRTFGAPGQQGGVGVRMLVPLIDMLNHAGDYILTPPGAPEPSVQAFDNVRWDLRAPTGPEGEWTMEVKATKDISAGEELLLSYGERSNDDFFEHYGFCPPRNPHDDVALFTDIESCIDWWLDAYLPTGVLSPGALQSAINEAFSSAEDQDGASMAAAQVLDAVPEAEADVIRAELARIKLSAGGMVDGRLLAAYRSLYEAAAAGGVAPELLGSSWGQHLGRAVAARCKQILRGMPTPLLDDLKRLAEWEAQSGQEQHSWGAALQHYAAAVGAFEAKHGGLHDGEEQQPGSASGSSTASGAELADAGADADLARMLLQHAQQQQQQMDAAEGSAGAAAGEGGSIGSLLPVTFRCYKKMSLWDAVLLES